MLIAPVAPALPAHKSNSVVVGPSRLVREWAMNFVRSASLLFASAVSPEHQTVGAFATDQTPLLRWGLGVLGEW